MRTSTPHISEQGDSWPADYSEESKREMGVGGRETSECVLVEEREQEVCRVGGSLVSCLLLPGPSRPLSEATVGTHSAWFAGQHVLCVESAAHSTVVIEE